MQKNFKCVSLVTFCIKIYKITDYTIGEGCVLLDKLVIGLKLWFVRLD